MQSCVKAKILFCILRFRQFSYFFGKCKGVERSQLIMPYIEIPGGNDDHNIVTKLNNICKEKLFLRVRNEINGNVAYLCVHRPL